MRNLNSNELQHVYGGGGPPDKCESHGKPQSKCKSKKSKSKCKTKTKSQCSC